jgi:hypothetical protein
MGDTCSMHIENEKSENIKERDDLRDLDIDLDLWKGALF